MYTSTGSSGLGPALRAGTGVATGAGLAFTGFPVIGFTLLGLVLLASGLVLARVAVVRRSVLAPGGDRPGSAGNGIGPADG